MDDLNNRRFVDKLRNGDTRAFHILFNRLVPILCSFLTKQFELHPNDAEEIASDAMLKVHKSVATFNPDGGAKLTTWIFEIARHTAIDFLRKRTALQKKAATSEAQENVQTQAATIAKSDSRNWYEMHDLEENPLEITPQMDATMRAFSSLSEEDQDVLRMHAVMEYDEIARREGIGVNAARVRHSRANKRLREAYEKENKDGRG